MIVVIGFVLALGVLSLVFTHLEMKEEAKSHKPTTKKEIWFE